MLEFILFFIVGFLAQLVDGALGMAYGVISMSVLLGFGIAPSAASASIHTAELCTTGASGLSHAMFKNINYRLFRRLLLPGIIGSIIGAYFLTKIPLNVIKPIISVYLLIMGTITLYRSLRKSHWVEKVHQLINRALEREKPAHRLSRLVPLGLVAGFSDAVGGGGWGAIISSSLLAQNDEEPRYTIGTSNLAEFLVALSSSITFFILIGIHHWRIVLGLILGGILAAPFAAFTVKYIPAKLVMFLAGLLVIIISIRTIFITFF